MAGVNESNSDSVVGSDVLSLESIRESLIRQEDTIVFSLIERSQFPLNALAFEDSGNSSSLTEFFVREIEFLQAKVGRYENPEENPFFLDNIPHPVFPTHKYPTVLHPKALFVNINKRIWDVYFKELLPLFVKPGDDGNYPSTAASDLACLQALSRRIHYGKFVAEVKFRDAPQDYEPAIRAKDTEALMKLLTFEKVEEMVKKRVQKKAETFGQEVKCISSDSGDESEKKYKVDPLVVSRIYGEWLIPLTKLVEVEYLLRRLD
ncbi:PREDICTED: chorismate mutase 2-like [Camelina sativa]|uniref:Chorismate mutase n=1 Tax=Camelina sativa TaxID=90675 RepID=A0ABM0T1T4_CAMSA|nr:PREDICTED: chorismate mutase 2-like [Camelina sativa]